VSEINVVVVGASWGGLAALSTLFKALPDHFSVPIVVVQHRSRHADNLLATLLQDIAALRVVDVEDKEPLVPNSVYVAPANYHLLIEQDHLSLTTDPLVRFSRPSIDVTFISAADAYRNGTVGVVLTGANDDGSRGLRHIVDLGGKAIVQNPATSESSTMPAASIRAVPEAEVLDLDKIAPRLVEIVSTSGNRKHRRAG
jgi:two-component system, chemotaxis family, protein-glutamate methylesterase/glutaminase